MKETGTWVSHMVRELSLTKLVKLTQVNGTTTCVTARASQNTEMAANMKGNGLRTPKKVLVLRDGRMVLASRGLTPMERRMASDFTDGKTEQLTTETGSTVRLTGSENIRGLICANSLVSGSTARLEASAFTHGLMVADMRASSPGTRDKGMEFT